MSANTDLAGDLLKHLPPEERLRVIADGLPDAANAVLSRPSSPEAPVVPDTRGDASPPAAIEDRLARFRSMRGLWKDLNVRITDEDIAEARREMWGNFPRDDI